MLMTIMLYNNSKMHHFIFFVEKNIDWMWKANFNREGQIVRTFQTVGIYTKINRELASYTSPTSYCISFRADLHRFGQITIQRRPASLAFLWCHHVDISQKIFYSIFKLFRYKNIQSHFRTYQIPFCISNTCLTEMKLVLLEPTAALPI